MFKRVLNLFRQTFQEWNEDRVPRLAAALSYYTVFSIAPLLIVVITIASLAFDQAAVTGRLDEQIQGLVGREGADMVQEMIRNAQRPAESTLATVIGVVTLLLGAAGVFGQLQDALNTVWGVEPKPGNGILKAIKDRFLSFTMVLGVGFLLLVSLVISAVLSGLHNFIAGYLPGAQFILQILNTVISFGVITLLFAMIYKFLPDLNIEWRDVWIGAAFTALLFTIGKLLIGLYLGNSSVASTYGAAGSLVIILLWIFYSAQILLFGAEFTQVYAHQYGSRREGVQTETTAETDKGTQKTTPEVVVPERPTYPAPQPGEMPLGQHEPVEHANDSGWRNRLVTAFGAVSALGTFIAGLLLGRQERAKR
jgi:membrane protein